MPHARQVRKLLAYRHPPFERNIFFDGDTRVRGPAVEMLGSHSAHLPTASSASPLTVRHRVPSGRDARITL